MLPNLSADALDRAYPDQLEPLMEQSREFDAALSKATLESKHHLICRCLDLPFTAYHALGGTRFLLSGAPHYTSLLRSNERHPSVTSGGMFPPPFWRCRFVAPQWFECVDLDIDQCTRNAFLKYHFFHRLISLEMRFTPELEIRTGPDDVPTRGMWMTPKERELRKRPPPPTTYAHPADPPEDLVWANPVPPYRDPISVEPTQYTETVGPLELLHTLPVVERRLRRASRDVRTKWDVLQDELDKESKGDSLA